MKSAAFKKHFDSLATHFEKSDWAKVKPNLQNAAFSYSMEFETAQAASAALELLSELQASGNLTTLVANVDTPLRIVRDAPLWKRTASAAYGVVAPAIKAALEAGGVEHRGLGFTGKKVYMHDPDGDTVTLLAFITLPANEPPRLAIEADLKRHLTDEAAAKLVKRCAGAD